MKNRFILLLAICTISFYYGIAQVTPVAKGNLFIIGGGSRSVELMQTMVSTAKLSSKDYIVILPMSSGEPDSSFFYISKDLAEVCHNPIVNFNFTKATTNHQPWLDSLKQAKLVFITGGDQNRFMEIVLNSPVEKAIRHAFIAGSTIAGTSAGAAVMSHPMITGNEISGDTTKSGSFKNIRYQMVQVKQGLGLLETAIVDQHFLARSRYNRLLSVLASYPSYPCIGIDERTAIIVHGKSVTVTGAGQVIKMSLPKANVTTVKKEGLVRLKDISVDILVQGDQFTL